MSSSKDNDDSKEEGVKRAPKLSKENPYYHKSHDYIYKDHADLEKKERELDMSYAEIHQKLEALILAVQNYEDTTSVIKLTQEIGTGVVQAEVKRKDLFVFFEHEDKHLEHLLDDKHLNQIYKDVSEKKHHHHHHHKDTKSSKEKRANTSPRPTSPSKGDERSSSADKLSKSNGAEHPKKQGMIIKKNGMRNKWAKRFFVLDSVELKYYESEESRKKPKAIISLVKAKIQNLVDGKESPTRFQLNYGDGKSILLECKDEQEKKEWITAISAVIDSVASQKAVSKTASSKSH